MQEMIATWGSRACCWERMEARDSSPFHLQISSLTPCSNELAFPSIYEEASKTVSVIVPAYNEEERMPEAMEEMITYLQSTAERQQ